jgi:hypothetical protein
MGICSGRDNEDRPLSVELLSTFPEKWSGLKSRAEDASRLATHKRSINHLLNSKVIIKLSVQVVKSSFFNSQRGDEKLVIMRGLSTPTIPSS